VGRRQMTDKDRIMRAIQHLSSPLDEKSGKFILYRLTPERRLASIQALTITYFENESGARGDSK
jgi:hypothetical protein